VFDARQCGGRDLQEAALLRAMRADAIPAAQPDYLPARVAYKLG